MQQLPPSGSCSVSDEAPFPKPTSPPHPTLPPITHPPKKLSAANTLWQPRIFNLMVSRVSLLQQSQPCYIGSSGSLACPQGNQLKRWAVTPPQMHARRLYHMSRPDHQQGIDWISWRGGAEGKGGVRGGLVKRGAVWQRGRVRIRDACMQQLSLLPLHGFHQLLLWWPQMGHRSRNYAALRNVLPLRALTLPCHILQATVQRSVCTEGEVLKERCVCVCVFLCVCQRIEYYCVRVCLRVTV